MMITSKEVIDRLIPKWKQWVYHYKSLRNIPFRKQFFCGYDLAGNTYWEFKLESSAQRWRRKLVPTRRQDHIFDYYETVPPMWHQWLRYTRLDPPTVDELLKDQERLRILKLNTSIIDQNQKNLSQTKKQIDQLLLQRELHKLGNDL